MTVAVELQITDVAFGGKGVARADGKAVFVPYVIDGESVSASITREHKKFLEAELETIITASPIGSNRAARTSVAAAAAFTSTSSTNISWR